MAKSSLAVRDVQQSENLIARIVQMGFQKDPRARMVRQADGWHVINVTRFDIDFKLPDQVTLPICVKKRRWKNRGTAKKERKVVGLIIVLGPENVWYKKGGNPDNLHETLQAEEIPYHGYCV